MMTNGNLPQITKMTVSIRYIKQKTLKDIIDRLKKKKILRYDIQFNKDCESVTKQNQSDFQIVLYFVEIGLPVSYYTL